MLKETRHVKENNEKCNKREGGSSEFCPLHKNFPLNIINK